MGKKIDKLIKDYKGTGFYKFWNSSMFYFHNGGGGSWTRLDALLMAISMLFIFFVFFSLMHVFFGSLNPG